MVIVGSALVGVNMHVAYPHLPFIEQTVSFLDTRFSVANTFDLGTGQYDPGDELVDKKVLKACLFVLYVDELPIKIDYQLIALTGKVIYSCIL